MSETTDWIIKIFLKDQLIFERFDLKELHGKSGMREVWLASDEHLEQELRMGHKISSSFSRRKPQR
ncbi:hypothetical protein N9B94_03850 [Verrucomicrobia bacterium]|nr:hypothetical protein [Verrucomicrobiota bacterium]